MTVQDERTELAHKINGPADDAPPTAEQGAAMQAVVERALAPVTSPSSRVASRAVDCNLIRWTPFPMPGTFFKLLNINETTGAMTILLYVTTEAAAPLHAHLGSAEAYNIFGTWGYMDETGSIGPNWYLYEPTSVVHLPETQTDALMFAVLHGPIMGFDENGAPAGLITADLLYDLATANSAVDHLPARANH